MTDLQGLDKGLGHGVRLRYARLEAASVVLVVPTFIQKVIADMRSRQDSTCSPEVDWYLATLLFTRNAE